MTTPTPLPTESVLRAAAAPALTHVEFDRLVEDIRANGLLEPIWVHPEDGSIIDGRNRYRACLPAGIEPTTRTWTGEGSLLEFVLSMNIHRRQLAVGQKACAAANALPMFEEEARARQMATSTFAPRDERGRLSPVPAKLPEPVTGEAREHAAELFGVSARYVSYAKRLKTEEPELFQAVAVGQKSMQDAKADIEQAKKAAVVAQIAQEPAPLPSGLFRVIVIDPPWNYQSRAEDITHRARNPYPDMDLAAIKALSVSARAHEDCVLWLWATNAFLGEAIECLNAWGFERKTILTWVKDSMGLGDWLRGQTEHCLIAVRGNPTVILTNQTSALSAPRREHSRKPDEFYALVESLCIGNKLDWFARESRDGWQSCGAERELFDVA